MSDLDSKQTEREADEAGLVKQLADEALAPWDGVVTGKGHAELRDLLEEVLATHPLTSKLVAELLPPPHVETSGEVPVDETHMPIKRRAAGGGGGGQESA